MTRRPRLPPAQLAAMPPRVTSSSGVGTYGGLNSCKGCQLFSGLVQRCCCCCC